MSELNGTTVERQNKTRGGRNRERKLRKAPLNQNCPLCGKRFYNLLGKPRGIIVTATITWQNNRRCRVCKGCAERKRLTYELNGDSRVTS
jgi:hypothetical protein